jgi:hypothetical protein
METTVMILPIQNISYPPGTPDIAGVPAAAIASAQDAVSGPNYTNTGEFGRRWVAPFAAALRAGGVRPTDRPIDQVRLKAMLLVVFDRIASELVCVCIGAMPATKAEEAAFGGGFAWDDAIGLALLEMLRVPDPPADYTPPSIWSYYPHLAPPDVPAKPASDAKPAPIAKPGLLDKGSF